MSVEIIQSGLQTSFQNAGRNGYRALGIHPTGAMDQEALYLANALVGNLDERATLEIHFPGGRYLFHAEACVSITGADFDPHIDGEPVDRNRLLRIAAGSTLSFSRPIQGARCYLAVAGGFALEQWLRSDSTDLAASAGGWKGRALVKGDRIPLNQSIRFKTSSSFMPEIHIEEQITKGPVCILPGPEWNQIPDNLKERFLQQSWTVTAQSNRMGLRLHGKESIGLKLTSMISAATEFGTIQCLPDGDLTVLMADHPVTGGYPRVAILPYYEWSRLAQAIPGTIFELQLTEHNEVHSKNLSYMAAGRMFRETIRSAVQSYLQQHVIEC